MREVAKMVQLSPTTEMPRRCANTPERGNEGLTSMRAESTSGRGCIVPGCDRPHNAHGYCRTHYGRWKRGTLSADAPPPIEITEPFKVPEEERFMRHVLRVDSGCWEWTGALSYGGYSRFGCRKPRKPGAYTRPNGVYTEYGHRWSYMHWVGPIPDGFQVDHLCGNTKCVNPDHLKAVTPKENVLRGTAITAQNARKTHCKNGHPLSGDNLIILRGGARRCAICNKQRMDAYHEKRRQQRAQGRVTE